MRKTLWLFPVLLGTAMTPLSCGDDEESTGTGGETGTPCERSEECEDNDPCTFDNCIVKGDGKFCVNDPAPNGEQPPEQQTDGDCRVLRCEGGAEVEADDDDPQDDPDDSDCMVPSCTDGGNVMIPADLGQGCPVNDNSWGACNDVGECSCAPGAAGQRVYVDATNGVDDTAHGAGPGSCAYATLDYALANATGEIVLLDGTYDSNNVAAFPITLTGNQVLICELDYNTDPATRITTISGSGAFGAGTATVVFGGTRNGIADCMVDAGTTADVAIAVDTAAADLFENGHAVWSTEVWGATTGIELTATGDNLFVGRSVIRDNTTNGVLFSGSDQSAYLDDNTFSGNGVDIACTDLNGSVFGESNGGPTCSMCENCGSF